MIDLSVIQETLLQRLQKLPPGHAVEVLTYKRNRGAAFVRMTVDSFLILEHGYNEERFDGVAQDQLKKLCKSIFKREFPRSTKVRLYNLGAFDEETWRNTRRKTI